jgi:SagB-type dehydrogenase family enzyme
LLEAVAQPLDVPGLPRTTSTGAYRRTSPSGGGRHPTDIYPYIKNVSGVPEGFYRYSIDDHKLYPIASACTDEELQQICGGQPWVSDAAVLLFYVSRFERTRWKYPNARAYRILMMDVGHLSQTVYLVAGALNLQLTYTAALRDELLENHLSLDLGEDLVLSCSVIGSSGGANEWANRA